jgi:hypothetical protein
MFWYLSGSFGGIATADSLTLSADLRNLDRDANLRANPNSGGRWYSAGGYSYFDGPMIFNAVPVPATMALLGLGLVGIGAARRKQAWH